MKTVHLHRLVGAAFLLFVLLVISFFVFDSVGLESRDERVTFPNQSEVNAVSPDFDTGGLITSETQSALQKEATSSVATPQQTTNQPQKREGVDGYVDHGTSKSQASNHGTSKSQVSKVGTTKAPDNAVKRKANRKDIKDIEKQREINNKEKQARSGWRVRVATFSEEKNAFKLRKMISEEIEGAIAHIKVAKGNNNNYTFILTLGPWQDKAQAEKIKRLVEFRYELKTVLEKQ